MNAPSERDIKKLFALSSNQCAFPDCISPIFTLTDEMVGEICHINTRSKGGPRYDKNQTEDGRHGFDNLLLLCRNHHKIVDEKPKVYTADWLKTIKHNHEQNMGGIIEITQSDAVSAHKLLDAYLNIHASDEAQVMVNSPGAIQTKNLIFKTNSKKQIPKVHPQGTIGADMDMHNYVAYLVKRFNEFRRAAQKTYIEKKPFSYAAIHTQIESIFGNQTYFIPQNRFTDLVNFLKDRIDGTPAGLRNQRLGINSYRSLEEHKQKSRGEL